MWSPTSTQASFSISIGEIHVWHLNLQPEAHNFPESNDCLTQDDYARAARFRFEEDRRRFLIRRGALRHILARYLNVTPKELQLETGPHGKPEIRAPSAVGCNLHFNCSHSADRGLIALALGRKTGVDIEKHTPIPEAMTLARAFFSPAEVAALEQLPVSSLLAAFYDCWTRKEAFVKALGTGLLFPDQRSTVSVGPNEPARVVEIGNNLDESDRWMMESLNMGEGWSAALVAQGDGAHLLFHDWRSSTENGSRAGRRD